jgi:Tfp pilus assembly protein PilF
VIRSIVICSAVAVLAGCASAPQPATTGSESVTPAPQTASPQEQTVSAMLERARAARLLGRLPEAESTLESALRIAPDDARLWLELAEVQFASGEFDAAQTLARRAVSLAAGDPAVIEAAQRLSEQLGE